MTEMTESRQVEKTIVIGLGKTGLSCARYLSARGIPYTVVDTRTEPPGLAALREFAPEVRVCCGPLDHALLAAAGRLIVSPGVSLREPAIQTAMAAGTDITGDIAMFMAEARSPVVAITGSNGKSTVTTLVHAMIRDAGRTATLGGNIGTPALELLEREPVDFHVLELSSFQLELLDQLDTAAATILNISMDHMDRYDGMHEYLAAKLRIFTGCQHRVINRDDPLLADSAGSTDAAVTGFTLGTPAVGDFGLRTQAGSEWLAHGEQLLIRADALTLAGRHNIANALAAFALGHVIGLDNASMCRTLTGFAGLPHRCEVVSRQRAVTWINDSKGTNPGASMAAITGLGHNNNLILIAGGDGKGADFAEFAEAARGRVRIAILIGRDAGRIGAVIDPAITVLYATTLEAAVVQADALAVAGDTVLLSPACASLDMFNDYQHRGEVFRRSVQALSNGGGVL